MKFKMQHLKCTIFQFQYLLCTLYKTEVKDKKHITVQYFTGRVAANSRVFQHCYDRYHMLLTQVELIAKFDHILMPGFVNCLIIYKYVFTMVNVGCRTKPKL